MTTRSRPPIGTLVTIGAALGFAVLLVGCELREGDDTEARDGHPGNEPDGSASSQDSDAASGTPDASGSDGSTSNESARTRRKSRTVTLTIPVTSAPPRSMLMMLAKQRTAMMRPSVSRLTTSTRAVRRGRSRKPMPVIWRSRSATHARRCSEKTLRSAPSSTPSRRPARTRARTTRARTTRTSDWTDAIGLRRLCGARSLAVRGRYQGSPAPPSSTAPRLLAK